jgi:hypothetical protein
MWCSVEVLRTKYKLRTTDAVDGLIVFRYFLPTEESHTEASGFASFSIVKMFRGLLHYT